MVGLGEAFTLKNPEDELKYIQFYKTLKEKNISTYNDKKEQAQLETTLICFRLGLPFLYAIYKGPVQTEVYQNFNKPLSDPSH